MHYGDLFYAACGLAIYYFSWPDPSVAKEWPALDATVVHSWVALVLARNLVLEVSFYEFWLLSKSFEHLRQWFMLVQTLHEELRMCM